MFTGIFKDTSVRILITFMITLCVLSSLVLPDWMQNNFMYGLSRGLAILGLMLLWRTNLVSFGHALYYGFGAYAVALCQKYFDEVILKVNHNYSHGENILMMMSIVKNTSARAIITIIIKNIRIFKIM